MKYKMYLLRDRSQQNSHQNTAKNTLTGENQSQQSKVIPSSEENQRITRSIPRHLQPTHVYPTINIGLNKVEQLTRDKTRENYHQSCISLVSAQTDLKHNSTAKQSGHAISFSPSTCVKLTILDTIMKRVKYEHRTLNSAQLWSQEPNMKSKLYNQLTKSYSYKPHMQIGWKTLFDNLPNTIRDHTKSTLQSIITPKGITIRKACILTNTKDHNLTTPNRSFYFNTGFQKVQYKQATQTTKNANNMHLLKTNMVNKNSENLNSPVLQFKTNQEIVYYNPSKHPQAWDRTLRLGRHDFNTMSSLVHRTVQNGTKATDNLSSHSSLHKAVKAMILPTTIKEIQSHLGLFQFFSDVIDNYARIAEPLTAVTSAEHPWKSYKLSGELPQEAIDSWGKLREVITSGLGNTIREFQGQKRQSTSPHNLQKTDTPWHSYAPKRQRYRINEKPSKDSSKTQPILEDSGQNTSQSNRQDNFKGPFNTTIKDNQSIMQRISKLQCQVVDKQNSIRQREKRITRILTNSDFTFLSDNEQLQAFDNTLTRYIASCVTKDMAPTYICNACSYQTGVKSHFTQHHLAQKHLENLEQWINIQMKIHKKRENIKNTQEGTTLKHPKNQVGSKQDDKKIHAMEENSTPNSHCDSHAKNTNPCQSTTDNIPIQTTIDTYKKVALSEQNLIDKIKLSIPNSYHKDMINLITTIFKEDGPNNIIIKLATSFTDISHWIAYKYYTLICSNNPRDYLLNKWLHGEHDFVDKTRDQRIEIQNISGAARTLFDILAPSTIPIQYLCMLAVLMTNQKQLFFHTKSTLDSHHVLDLLLKEGVFTIVKVVEDIPAQKISKKNKKDIIPIGFTTLCIKGLNKTCRTACLQELFSPFPSLTKIMRITNTTAIAKFRKFSEAERAMKKFNGSIFAQNTITVTMANKVPSLETIQNKHLHAPKQEQIILSHTRHADQMDSQPIAIQERICHSPQDEFHTPNNDPIPIQEELIQSSLNEGYTLRRDSNNKHLSVEDRLQNFNDNAWKVISTKNVTVHPYCQHDLTVKISQNDGNYTVESTKQQCKFVITCGLQPLPQIIDGIYKAQNSITHITIRNSSKSLLSLTKGEPILGVTAHTCRFVAECMEGYKPKYLEQPEYSGRSFPLTQWHTMTKTFKKMNAWHARSTILKQNHSQTSLNYWSVI